MFFEQFLKILKFLKENIGFSRTATAYPAAKLIQINSLASQMFRLKFYARISFYTKTIWWPRWSQEVSVWGLAFYIKVGRGGCPGLKYHLLFKTCFFVHTKMYKDF